MIAVVSDDPWTLSEPSGEERPRWNDWSRVYSVQFDNEQASQPRAVRLACAAMRTGDPVQIIERGRTTTGTIAGIISSVVHVSRRAVQKERT